MASYLGSSYICQPTAAFAESYQCHEDAPSSLHQLQTASSAVPHASVPCFMNAAHEVAKAALKDAERAVGDGRLLCLRDNVLSDLRRFRNIVSGPPEAAANNDVLNAIASYLVVVKIVADKPIVVQALLHERLYSSSETAHAAVDQHGRLKASQPRDTAMSTQRRQDHVLEVANAADMRDETVQLEALAMIFSQEKRTGPSSDPVVVAIKQKLLSVATTAVKSQVSRVPDWYVSENDLDFLSKVSDSKFEAIHLPTGRLVQVQCLAAMTSEAVATAAGLWRGIRHENVSALVGASHFSSPQLEVTEYCALGSLDTFLHANESARAHFALSLLLQAAHGVSAMHSAGVVHGDLRCANIGVTAEQQAKVKGLSHCVDSNAQRLRQYTSGSQPVPDAAPLARQQVRWLAPECVASGAVLSPASDVYAFGMMLYEAMTGRVPFDDRSEEDVMEMKKSGDASLPEHGMEQIDREVRVIIQDACNANPIFRPSIQIMVMSLRSLARASAVTAASTQPVYVTRMQAHAASPVATHASAVQPVSFNPTHSTTTPLGSRPNIPTQSAPNAAPVSTATSKGSVTVYPVATPPGFSNYQAPPAQAVVTPLSGVWQGYSQQQWGSTMPMTQPPQQAWSGSGAYPPPMDTQPETPTGRSKKARVIGLIVVIVIAIVVPFTTMEVLTSSSGSDNSDGDSSRSPTPTPSSSLPGVTPAPTPKARMGTTSTFQDTFTTNTINALTVDSTGAVYAATATQIYRFEQSSSRENLPTAYAGTSSAGYSNGNRPTAAFHGISGLAVDSVDTLLIVDSKNYRIRSISSGSNTVATAVGTGVQYTNDGAEGQAAFNDPRYVGLDQSGKVYISDGWLVHVWDRSARTVSILANLGSFSSFAVSPTGVIYLAKDSYVSCYDRMDGYIRTIGGTNTPGYRDEQGTGAAFGQIGGIALSPTGEDLYISDTGNHCIRRLNIATKQVTTFAGLCQTSGIQDGDGATARFNKPTSIAVSKSGIVYVADNDNTVRRIV